jgi:hypothetical protein
MVGDFNRGMQTALQIAIMAEEELAKSMAHFSTVHEWRGYKSGVTAYKIKLEELRDV